MATWAIGDVQGCWEPLERLLVAIDFTPGRDRIVLLGDLVNRGPDSLAVLRWAQAMSGSVQAVLGNHDLHLLARAAGVQSAGARDSLDGVLAAADRDVLLRWLRYRPLLLEESGMLLVHAGLLPEWTVADALAKAQAVERVLRGPDHRAFLARLHSRERPEVASAAAQLERVLRWATLLTRLRACSAEGQIARAYTGPITHCPAGTRPWFQWPTDRARTVVFGHWAALGACRGPNWIALDSGCVWGRSLTALRLTDGATVSVPAQPRLPATAPLQVP